jgi:hypothetical protein
MERTTDGGNNDRLPDVPTFKQMIAKVILYKTTYKLVRSENFPQSHIQVCTYVVSLVSDRLGDQLDLDRVWGEQEISTELKDQIQVWIVQVHQVLHETAQGRQISEWAKKSECWKAVRTARYNTHAPNIPEMR